MVAIYNVQTPFNPQWINAHYLILTTDRPPGDETDFRN